MGSRNLTITRSVLDVMGASGDGIGKGVGGGRGKVVVVVRIVAGVWRQLWITKGEAPSDH